MLLPGRQVLTGLPTSPNPGTQVYVTVTISSFWLLYVIVVLAGVVSTGHLTVGGGDIRHELMLQ